MLTEKETDDYLSQAAKELESTGEIVTLEDIKDFKNGRAAYFQVIVPIPTTLLLYHMWEDEDTVHARCTESLKPENDHNTTVAP